MRSSMPSSRRTSSSALPTTALVNTRLGCETLCTTNKIVIAGEGRGQLFRDIHGVSVVDRELITQIARDVVKDIGYDQNGFSYHGADVEVLLHGQSPDIAMGVDAKKKKSGEEEGAGDQGMMFGYACTESEVYEKGSFMPAPIFFAHQHSEGAVGEAPQRPACRSAARRQEPGHGEICRRQAGRLHQGRGLDPAQREEPQRQEILARPDQGHDLDRGRIGAAEGLDAAEVVRLPGQPDRQFRGRRSRRRLRPHRTQDHRRHLWRLCPAWRRRVLRQGSDQGRSLGRLCRALSRQERGRGRPCRSLHHPGRLRDRRRRSDVGAGRYPRHRQGRREEAREGAAADLPADADQHPPYAEAEPSDLPRTAAYGHFGRAPEKDGGFSWEKTDLAGALKSAV